MVVTVCYIESTLLVKIKTIHILRLPRHRPISHISTQIVPLNVIQLHQRRGFRVVQQPDHAVLEPDLLRIRPRHPHRRHRFHESTIRLEHTEPLVVLLRHPQVSIRPHRHTLRRTQLPRKRPGPAPHRHQSGTHRDVILQQPMMSRIRHIQIPHPIQSHTIRSAQLPAPIHRHRHPHRRPCRYPIVLVVQHIQQTIPLIQHQLSWIVELCHRTSTIPIRIPKLPHERLLRVQFHNKMTARIRNKHVPLAVHRHPTWATQTPPADHPLRVIRLAHRHHWRRARRRRRDPTTRVIPHHTMVVTVCYIESTLLVKIKTIHILRLPRHRPISHISTQIVPLNVIQLHQRRGFRVVQQPDHAVLEPDLLRIRPRHPHRRHRFHESTIRLEHTEPLVVLLRHPQVSIRPHRHTLRRTQLPRKRPGPAPHRHQSGTHRDVILQQPMMSRIRHIQIPHPIQSHTIRSAQLPAPIHRHRHPHRRPCRYPIVLVVQHIQQTIPLIQHQLSWIVELCHRTSTIPIRIPKLPHERLLRVQFHNKMTARIRNKHVPLAVHRHPTWATQTPPADHPLRVIRLTRRRDTRIRISRRYRKCPCNGPCWARGWCHRMCICRGPCICPGYARRGSPSFRGGRRI